MGRYQQFAAADAMRSAADNPGGGGAMGDMLGMGMGLAMANQMAGTMGDAAGGTQTGGPPPAPSAGPAFHVDLGNGQQGGPFSVAQLQQAAAQGQLEPTTMVWTTGMAEWAAARDVAALAGIFQAPPPPPSSSAPPPPSSGDGDAGEPTAGDGE
jgi:membrane protease subunit (stomatin/prohibitin family)